MSSIVLRILSKILVTTAHVLDPTSEQLDSLLTEHREVHEVRQKHKRRRAVSRQPVSK